MTDTTRFYRCTLDVTFSANSEIPTSEVDKAFYRAGFAVHGDMVLPDMFELKNSAKYTYVRHVRLHYNLFTALPVTELPTEVERQLGVVALPGGNFNLVMWTGRGNFSFEEFEGDKIDKILNADFWRGRSLDS
jgi:hypothetical protein